MEIGKPEEFIREMDFKEMVPAGENSLRVGSKMYLLLLGIVREEFQYNEVIGKFESLDKEDEDFDKEAKKFRNDVNIYSVTEMKKLKSEFISKGYLEQQEKYGGYSLTETGMAVLVTYKNLVRVKQMVNILEYARLEDQIQIISTLGEIKQNTANIPRKAQERLMEEADSPDEYEDIWQESVREDIKSNYGLNRDFESEIEKYLKRIEMGGKVIIEDTDSQVEEIEEIREMIDNVTENKHVPEFGGGDEEPDLYKKFDERKGN